MFPQIETVDVTTDGSQAATVYSTPIRGRLESIEYVKTDFTDGVDFTITNETTGETLWTESNVNAAKVCCPRRATHSTLGVAATYDGTRAVLDHCYLCNDRVKIIIASGGSATTGAFRVVWS